MKTLTRGQRKTHAHTKRGMRKQSQMINLDFNAQFQLRFQRFRVGNTLMMTLLLMAFTF